MNFKRLVLCLVLLFTPLLIGGSMYLAQSNTREVIQPDIHWLKLAEKIKYQTDHFPGKAGIYIKDLRTGWVIEHNSSALFPSASLVKIPVMAALYDAQADGRVSMDEILPLQRRNKTAGSGRLKRMRVGTKLTVRELVQRMITESDNTATNMLTDLFGLEYYNSYFLKLGLRYTNFSRTIMDLRKRDEGVENYTTPRDMAQLLEMIYRRKLTGSNEMIEILKGQKIADRLARSIPKDWPIGHKTGLMRDSCHDVGIVFSPTNDYIICALTQDIRSFRRAKGFISEISYITAGYYADPSVHPVPKKSFWSRVWKRGSSAG